MLFHPHSQTVKRFLLSKQFKFRLNILIFKTGQTKRRNDVFFCRQFWSQHPSAGKWEVNCSGAESWRLCDLLPLWFQWRQRQAAQKIKLGFFSLSLPASSRYFLLWYLTILRPCSSWAHINSRNMQNKKEIQPLKLLLRRTDVTVIFSPLLLLLFSPAGLTQVKLLAGGCLTAGYSSRPPPWRITCQLISKPNGHTSGASIKMVLYCKNKIK